MTQNSSDVTRSGPELVNAETGHWIVAADVTKPLLIFIHGFTSHGSYLAKLAEYANRHGFTSAIFNYDSYLGIDRGAADLRVRLQALGAHALSPGYALAGHSMGGLVALQFAANELLDGMTAPQGIAVLGTPVAGALTGRKIVSYMLDWADALTGPNPYSRTKGCRASLQLTGNDPERLLESLNAQLRHLQVPTLSVSGGLNALDFGSNRFNGMTRNFILQRLIGEIPNDGLVGESSADLSRAMPAATHRSGYSGWTQVNHTYLTSSQSVDEIVIEWLRERTRRPTSGHSPVPNATPPVATTT